MSARLRIVAAGVAAVLALLAAAPFALLAGIDAGLLNGVVRAAFSAQLNRKVTFGSLKADLFAREPRLTFTDLHIGEPGGFGAGDMAHVRTLDLTLNLWPLLAGRFDAPTIAATGLELHLKRRGPGDDNWTFGRKGTGGQGASGFLKGTRRLAIAAGHVDMDDPQRRLTLSGAISNDADDPQLPLHLQGAGMLKGADFHITARAGALNGRAKAAPWPFKATLTDGATRIDMDAATQQPFDLDVLDMQMTAAGPNLADLYYLFGFTPLNSRPYRVTGRLRVSGKTLLAEGLHGRIGDSDIAGSLSSDQVGARRRLSGRLSSRTLAAADLATLLASLPPRLTARSQPGLSGKGETPKGRVFSQTPFSISRLQAEDLRIDYSAAALTGFDLPLSDLHGRLAITDGTLAFAPVSAALAGGTVRAAFSLKPGRPDSQVTLKLDMHDVRLSGLTHGAGGVGGALGVSIAARGGGSSLAGAAADASGEAGFRLQRGAIPKADAAALGGDLFWLIGAKLGAKGARTGLRCAAGDFQIANGVMHAKRLVIATDTSAAVGGGDIDLGHETLALRLLTADVGPKPAVQLSAPITITGTLAQPKVGAELTKGKLDVSGLFGALVRPFKPPAPAPVDHGC